MNALTQIIREEIQKRGAITFARFMELALYCPEYGYYERESDTVGREGDFYTSVSVGTLFGELLAFQFAEWLEKIPADKIQIVEAGAHDGQLAADILRWMKRFRPDVFERLNYMFIEPSTTRQLWQQKNLAEFSSCVRWIPTLPENSFGKIHGVVFANELLDAMPVHRLFWDAARRDWFEWGVGVSANGFDWFRLEKTIFPAELKALPDELLNVLPDGYVFEISLEARQWWRDAARFIETGFLMTSDYGSFNEFGINPNNSVGTLRSYQNHKGSNDVLASVGEQDITAHVDFRAIQLEGDTSGLKTESFETQSKFLLGIATRLMKHPSEKGSLTSGRSRELQTLTHPEFLGRAFRVLVQSRFGGAYGQPVGSIA
jgi:SAM-dependent MidA family methyltransferase